MTAPTPEEMPACPIETAICFVNNKWQVLILRDLCTYGTMRFKDVHRCISQVSSKVLTNNLRTMEENGLVNRKVYAEVPPRVEYTLTDLGRTLEPIVEAYEAWGKNYKESQQRRYY